MKIGSRVRLSPQAEEIRKKWGRKDHGSGTVAAVVNSKLVDVDWDDGVKNCMSVAFLTVDDEEASQNGERK